ncbi:MAG: 2-oxoacid:acceptor oxidoreductase subunit alpha [Acidobacteriota bacterium]|jgi:2-oxoglutarate/2-oxoacid ferredoxin oxidoreductase subunit alpha
MAEKIVKFLSGNEACAEGAIAAGCRFFGGYPISPSSEIAEIMSRRLPQVGGRFIQMEDELASIAVILGASLAGSKSMTATSGPGFSLMQENIGFGMMAEIPTVVVNVMRGGPSTGNPTGPSQSDVMQTRWGTHGDHPAVVLSPATVREVFDMTVAAFNLSELVRIPVILAMDEIIGHMREKIEFPAPGELKVIDRKKPNLKPGETYYPYEAGEDLVPAMANFGEGYRYHVTGLNHDRTGFPTGNPDLLESGNRRLMEKIVKNHDKLIQYESVHTDDAEVLVVAFGSTSRSARRAIEDARKQGVKAGMFRPITLFPQPGEALLKAASKARKIVVPEMNLGQYILEIQRIVGGKLPVTGVNLVNGEPIQPSRILQAIVGD